jgi:hypothetical protein
MLLTGVTPATFLCLFWPRTRMTIGKIHGLSSVNRCHVRGGCSFVDIRDIVDHHCLYYSIICLYVLCSELRCPLRFPRMNDVRFVFNPYLVVEGSMSVCLRIVVSNTYCVLYLFCLSSSCVPLCCQFLWIAHFWLTLWYSLTFI